MRKYSAKQYMLLLVAIVFTIVFLFPIYWMITTSIKPIQDVFATPPMIIPESIQFDAYAKNLIEDQSLLPYLKNSFIIATGTAIFTLVIALPCAYALARFRLKGASILILILLITQMIPGIMMAMPLFILFSKLELLNSYLALIIGNTTTALPFAIVVMRPFFLSIPKGLEDAAVVDGCNAFTAFIRIILPLTKPTVLTVGTFSFLFAWGDLIFALTLATEEKIRPLTMGLTKFIGQYGTQWDNLMSVSTIAAAPIIIIFLLLQKYIVSGITAGSEK
ncbi:carbohydrate ABC transporter permease [Lederbergia lenta]|uniref:Sugar ABC transporter permease n=1 Tax=Lederbergia lenta TaxID=1467 RepID=A0A2X4VXA9_LEDLE|nr:carbohydrate ABC transporter permease [Lederbergia lenta]MCM3111204.1 carbohydrate ABC transporter permease [Lederbergia lenta]MEC2325408.1 carbohydrate ABC transporter permease [Lederbergia lenta]SQI55443.1 sugar ABC transporter permease [Lederbergia lenta]